MFKDINKKEINSVAKKFNLNFLGLFGSQATGSAGENSDFDIAYSRKGEISYSDEVFLQEELAGLLKTEVEKIDLVNVAKAGPLLMKQIAQEGKVLAEPKKNSFDYFVMYAYSRYLDAKFLLNLQKERVKKP